MEDCIESSDFALDVRRETLYADEKAGIASSEEKGEGAACGNGEVSHQRSGESESNELI